MQCGNCSTTIEYCEHHAQYEDSEGNSMCDLAFQPNGVYIFDHYLKED